MICMVSGQTYQTTPIASAPKISDTKMFVVAKNTLSMITPNSIT